MKNDWGLMTSAHGQLALLVGNGLSIAFNEELRLERITSEVIARLESLGLPGTPAVHTLKNIAKRVALRGGNPDENFEDLVGVFEAELLNFDYMQELASLISPEDEQLKDAFQQVIDFTQNVQTIGVSHVLEVILNNSHGSFDAATDLHELVKAIRDSFLGRITIGNLNYDTLLLSSLMFQNSGDFADLGHGSNVQPVSVGNGKTVSANLLRETSTFPYSARIRLLHLHGSLTFWLDRESGKRVKLRKELLSEYDLFEKLRNGTSQLRPLVVLTSSATKSEKIQSEPYKLAYSIFDESLAEADKWLVIGYSFRDPSINALLQDNYMRRASKPEVFVVTLGENPALSEIAGALGLELDQARRLVKVHRGGAQTMTASREWREFSGAESA